MLAGAGRPSDPDVRELAQRPRRRSADGSPGPGNVTVAIADRCERPDDYAPAFRLARESVELMLKLGRRGADRRHERPRPVRAAAAGQLARRPRGVRAHGPCARCSSTTAGTAATSPHPPRVPRGRPRATPGGGPLLRPRQHDRLPRPPDRRAARRSTSATPRRSSTSRWRCGSSTCSARPPRRTSMDPAGRLR